MKERLQKFVWGNGIACLSGLAWAYVAYRYNRLNIGGDETRFTELWIAASGVLPYLTLAIWVAVLVVIAAEDSRRALPVSTRVFRMGATLLIMPLSLIGGSWFFLLGFQVAPV